MAMYGRTCIEVDCSNINTCDECKIGKKLKKLADYEKIGLSVEDIKCFKEEQSNIFSFIANTRELRNKYHLLLGLYDELQKERDYYKSESIKDKAKLGEIRILIGK